MRIAMISMNEYLAPLADDVINGSIYISSLLSEGLAKKNHEVFSIVGRGSTLNTKQVFSRSQPFFEIINKYKWEKLNDYRLMWQLMVPFEMDLYFTLLEFLKIQKVDLVHFHPPLAVYGIPCALRIKQPCLFTLHYASTPLEIDIIKNFSGSNIHFISLSNNQRDNFRGLNFIETVYNGIAVKKYNFNKSGGNALVISGRIKEDKGIVEAIEVSKLTKKPLNIAGDTSGSKRKYFNDVINPLINKNHNLITYFGFINRSMMDSFFKRGKLMLFPILWEEPFGLVMVEAMATGTPVVAFARGSVPEVVKDGETGYIVNPSDKDIRGSWIIKKTGIAGLCEAVEKIYTLPQDQYLQMRRNCRKHVEANFTVEKMVEGYEKVYRRILNRKD